MIPKLDKIMTYGGQRGYLIVAKGGSLTEAQAAEVIRIVEAYPKLLEIKASAQKVCRIYFEIAAEAIGEDEVRKQTESKVEQALSEAQDD